MQHRYSPPASPYDSPYAPSTANEAAVSDVVLHHLRRTKPWVTFLGILALIGAGLMGLFAILMIGLGGASGIAGAGPLEGATVIGMGLAYLALGGLYIAPGLFLVRYGSAIQHLLGSGDMHHLENALDHQTRFWRFTGIFAAVMMGLYGFAIVIAILVGIAGVASM